jgi:hypothetical protein
VSVGGAQRAFLLLPAVGRLASILCAHCPLGRRGRRRVRRPGAPHMTALGLRAIRAGVEEVSAATLLDRGHCGALSVGNHPSLSGTFRSVSRLRRTASALCGKKCPDNDKGRCWATAFNVVSDGT